jgi:arabinan endo-1,5-alpha-L-arabinosidase
MQAPWAAAAEGLTGDTDIHDPSTIVRCGECYWVFGTGRGIISRYSTNLVVWHAGPSVFTNAPAWANDWVPNHRGRFWAPDIIHLGDRYLLYYSVSTWGSRQSAIGLAVTRSLDPGSRDYRWEDRGAVIQTTTNDTYNAIDPSVLLDRDGRLWMAFGSCWSGIKLVELSRDTGLRVGTSSPVYALAWNESIEAPGLLRRGDDYFLFVNWGQCCRGTDSTYEIRVGRGRTIAGPYLDREGVNLLNKGGSRFLSTSGDYIGPGHAAFVERAGTTWMSYHYYNRARFGRGTLDLLPLRWDEGGWPVVEGRGR